MTARPVAEAAEDAPGAATAAVAANPATTGTRIGAKQQLLVACQAAEHWLRAELDRPGETRPDDILRVLRAAIERAEGQRKARETRQPGQSRPSNRRPRESSKEAMLIEMLSRPEGATIAQIMAATGVEWGGSALSPCGDRFLHPPLRTGRASFPASGSPCFSSSLRARQNGGSGRSW